MKKRPNRNCLAAANARHAAEQEAHLDEIIGANRPLFDLLVKTIGEKLLADANHRRLGREGQRKASWVAGGQSEALLLSQMWIQSAIRDALDADGHSDHWIRAVFIRASQDAYAALR